MGIRKEGNKFRVDVSVKGRGRKTKVVDTYNEAVAVDERLRKALIDGKDVPAGRATNEVTLKQACEACWEDPETGWRNTDHGRKQKYYFSKFSLFFLLFIRGPLAFNNLHGDFTEQNQELAPEMQSEINKSSQ